MAEWKRMETGSGGTQDYMYRALSQIISIRDEAWSKLLYYKIYFNFQHIKLNSTHVY